jgi:hypothetical protein
MRDCSEITNPVMQKLTIIMLLQSIYADDFVACLSKRYF